MGLAMVLLAYTPAAVAQKALSVSPEKCVFRMGDGPGWEATSLDERDWQPLAQLPEKQQFESRLWVRCTVLSGALAESIQPTLQVDMNAAYEVYVAGRLVGRHGDLASGSHTTGVVNQYRAAEFENRSSGVLVALRISETPTIYGQQPTADIRLGDAEFLRDARAAAVARNVRRQWITWVGFGGIAMAGVFFLTLFQFDRSQKAILWLGTCWVLLAMIRLDDFLLASAIPIPSRLELVLYAIGNLNAIPALLFPFALVQRKLGWFYRGILVMTAGSVGVLAIAGVLPTSEALTLRWYLDSSPAWNNLWIPVYMLAETALITAFWPLHRMQRGMMPIYVACFFWGVMEMLYMGVQIPVLGLDPYSFLNLQAPRTISIACVVAAMTLLLLARIRSTNQEKAKLAGEMAAAQTMQRLLVPEVQSTAAGLRIEAVFLPATEVGGDFYRCRVLPDGSQWILLGDVSGKGAAAAMAGAMLLGASEGHQEDSPAVLLGHLNRAFCHSGVGGFATCQAVRIWPDGRVRIANAGHLPPYVDGAEVPVHGGLPLGITDAEQYDEAEFELNPGQTLTLLSDGVVEARNAAGELFGFTRTAESAKGSARSLAEAAQSFGQEDDITVLTVALAR